MCGCREVKRPACKFFALASPGCFSYLMRRLKVLIHLEFLAKSDEAWIELTINDNDRKFDHQSREINVGNL